MKRCKCNRSFRGKDGYCKNCRPKVEPDNNKDWDKFLTMVVTVVNDMDFGVPFITSDTNYTIEDWDALDRARFLVARERAWNKSLKAEAESLRGRWGPEEVEVGGDLEDGVEDATDFEYEAEDGQYLESRIPGYTEVKFVGLQDHHLDAIEALRKRLGGLPMCDETFVGLDSIALVGIKDRLGNIKMDLQAAWSAVATVRGPQCPASLMPLRHMDDAEIASMALEGSIARGMLTVEDISWALRVSNELGEPCSSLDESSIKSWELNKARDRAPEAGPDIRYPDASLAVDIDDPVDIAGTTSTEGVLGQLQVCEAVGEMTYDMWLEERNSQWTDRKGEVHTSEFWDPQAGTKKALYACVRGLMSQADKAQARDGKLVWHMRGFGRGLSAACRLTSAKSGAPWEFAIPVEIVYDQMAADDAAFGQLWECVKKIQVKAPGFDQPIHLRCHGERPVGEGSAEWLGSWRTKMRMLRMWSILRDGGVNENGVVTKHIRVKVWINKDRELRVALGLPSAAPASRAPASRTPINKAPSVRAAK